MFGPVFRADLVRISRRRRHFFIRTIYGLLLLLIMWSCYSATVGYPGYWPDSNLLALSAMFADQFFRSLATLQIVTAMLVTVAISAGTIAEERDRRTIEYLFTTNLSNAEIVLDKLFVRLGQMFGLMSAVLPVIALSMLFGGIALRQLFNLVVATCCVMLTCASVSVFVSVHSRRTRGAMTVSSIIILLLCFGPFPVAVLPANFPSLSWLTVVNDHLLQGNPFYFVFGGGPFGGVFGPDAVYRFVRNNALLSLLLLLLSVAQVRRSALRTADESLLARLQFRLPTWRPRLRNRPMLWKELFAEQTFGTVRWGSLLMSALALGGVLLFGYFFWLALTDYRLQPAFEDSIRGTIVFLSALFLLLLGARCAGSITHERERQTWDTLRITLLNRPAILLAKFVGSVYALRVILLLALALWAMEWLLPSSEHWRSLAVIGTALGLAPAFGATGLLLSQCLRSSTSAIAWSVVLWLMTGIGYVVLVQSLLPWRAHDNDVVWAPCALFLLMCPAIDDSITLDMHYVYTAGMLLYAAIAVLLLFARQKSPWFCRHFGLPRLSLVGRAHEPRGVQ